MIAPNKLLAALLAALLTAPVLANDLAEVTKLLRAGKTADALAKANASLAVNPSDPQMRFMKGVLLTEQNKTAEAITVFTKLTEDYKDLPEPYNNLAVLYADSGEFEKARIALEKAIRTNPSYMTAYENLGDVYGKLASQAYDKALALGTAPQPSAKPKLTLLRTFSSSTGSTGTKPGAIVPAAVSQPAVTTASAARAQEQMQVPLISPIPERPKNVPPLRIPSLAVTPPSAPSTAAAALTSAQPKPVPTPAPAALAAAKPAPLPAPPAPAPALAAAKPAPVIAATQPKPAPATPAAAQIKLAPAAAVTPSAAAPAIPAAASAPPQAKPAATGAAVAAQAPGRAEPKPDAKPAADAEGGAVLSRVSSWAKAWSAQDVNGYLNYYSKDFAPPKGLSRQAWADERRARIAGKGRIRVEVQSPQVTIDGDIARVNFRQVYESDRLSANSRKTLVMVKQGGQWQIKQELSGS